MKQVTLDQARQSLPDLVSAAVEGEEVILLADGDRPAVRLVPVGAFAGTPRARFGSARGLISMAEDFDAPLPDFEPYSE
jgi:antitoxin (DNA-binding transcriptional repressor) of toxin-antitoxin stability system